MTLTGSRIEGAITNIGDWLMEFLYRVAEFVCGMLDVIIGIPLKLMASVLIILVTSAWAMACILVCVLLPFALLFFLIRMIF